MKLKCIIIDDEPLAINVIKNHLEFVNEIEIVDTFHNALDGLNFLNKHEVDLIFLDINMPVLDGIDFIKSLDKKPIIVVTTAHREFAIETYELDVLDYLVKPISLPRFLKSKTKILRKFNEQSNSNIHYNERPFLFVKIDKKKMKKIFYDEILVVESLKDYLKINTTSSRYIIHQTLSSFTEQLPSNNFIRINRSYTIAIDKIDSLEGNSIEIGGIRCVIGRTYIEEVKNRILKR